MSESFTCTSDWTHKTTTNFFIFWTIYTSKLISKNDCTVDPRLLSEMTNHWAGATGDLANERLTRWVFRRFQQNGADMTLNLFRYRTYCFSFCRTSPPRPLYTGVALPRYPTEVLRSPDSLTRSSGKFLDLPLETLHEARPQTLAAGAGTP